uniref:Uncharacterized protein n=1 Tax=Arundo donax TaxID=35708 RepID=A0A0A8YGG5_ARUDO
MSGSFFVFFFGLMDPLLHDLASQLKKEDAIAKDNDAGLIRMDYFNLIRSWEELFLFVPIIIADELAPFLIFPVIRILCTN